MSVRGSVKTAIATAVALVAISAYFASGLLASPTRASAAPHVGGSIVIDVTQDPGTLNPFQDGGIEGNYVSSDIRDRLVDPSPQGQPAPALATSWSQPTPTSYIFNLRHGVRFSNGAPFTAADVKYTFKELLGPKSQLAGNWTYIKNVKVINPYKVQIFMTSAYPFLLEQLALNSDAGIVPNGWLSKCGSKCDTTVIGTGPFMLKQWVKGSFLTLARNPYYWGKPKPYLDQVTFRVVPNPESQVVQLKSGAADVLYTVPYPYISVLKKSSGVRLYTHRSGTLMELLMNSSVPPFNNINVRKAMEYGINKQQIIKTILLGFGAVPSGLVPAGNKYYDPSLKAYPYDPAKAKALLATAGYTASKPLSFTLRTINTSYFESEAALIQSQLKAIGVNINIVPMEKSAFLAPLFRSPGTNPKGWQGGLEQYTFGNSTESLVWEQYAAGSYINTSYVNRPGTGGFTDPTLQRLVTQGIATTNVAKLKRIYHQLYQRIEQDALYVRISFADNIQAARSRVHGFQALSQFEYPLSRVWVSG